jgi:potassium-transporting ATPase KdpC subunit
MKTWTDCIVKALRPALALFIVLWAVTGLVYPLAVYVGSQTLFPSQAQGSLIINGGRVAGSALIGQHFSSDRYFWPRPSMTQGYPYNPLASSGSNLGPTNINLVDSISNRTAVMMAANGVSEVPSDLVMASASGLDPHISLAAARVQVSRVGKARGMGLDAVNRLVDEHTEKPFLAFLGRERVNVLLLNSALDEQKQ